MDRMKKISEDLAVGCDFDEGNELEMYLYYDGGTICLTLNEVVELQHHLSGVLTRYVRRNRITKT